jgi:NAD(P)-dependent dehydrogenase (short-subunit alcohol dehydrogenase family)
MDLGTAVIVGVGPGLGLALARAFADAGHPVAMLARDKASLDTFAAELASPPTSPSTSTFPSTSNPSGRVVRGYVADVADPGDLRAALHSAISELGAPDVVVYNIAVVRKDSPIGGDDEDWANVLAINVLGGRVTADAVLPELRNGRGSLLFTGGGFALRPTKEYASLSVGKTALRAYVKVLHDQLAGTGVHVTSVMITTAIGSEPRFDPAVIAQAYIELHNQPETEWQYELVY